MVGSSKSCFTNLIGMKSLQLFLLISHGDLKYIWRVVLWLIVYSSDAWVSSSKEMYRFFS